MRKLLVFLVFAGLVAYLRRPHPPKSVDVFGTQYRIDVVSEIPGNPDIYGYTDCKMHVITMRGNWGDPRATLFHELTHAMACYTDRVGSGVDNLEFNSSDSEKHEGIYTFTASWRETFKRNPGLAEYIGG